MEKKIRSIYEIEFSEIVSWDEDLEETYQIHKSIVDKYHLD